MKIMIVSILSIIFIPLMVSAQIPTNEDANRAIWDFNQRLENVYHQSDSRTSSHQIIFGSVEAITAYKLGSLITKRDQKALRAIALQMKTLSNPLAGGNTPYAEYAGTLTPEERARVTKDLGRKLKNLEGSLVTKAGRGVMKILVRGGQVFLVLDLGARIYVLNALQNRDPDIFPLGPMTCSQLNCGAVVEQAIYMQNEAYKAARRGIH
jgi:hypothetical protein